MSDTESKIIKLLSSAKKKSEEESVSEPPARKIDLKIAVIVLLVACLFGLVTWEHSAGVTEKERVAALNARLGSLQKDLAAKSAEAKKAEVLKEVQAYADKLQIENVKVTNMNHEVRVSGKITNTGAREIEDIELTIFCLDDHDEPVCEEHHVASSPDYEPLKKYQNRRFRVTMRDVPPESKEIEVIVSNIEFADSEGKE